VYVPAVGNVSVKVLANGRPNPTGPDRKSWFSSSPDVTEPPENELPELTEGSE
jgi:hypothetical protein